MVSLFVCYICVSSLFHHSTTGRIHRSLGSNIYWWNSAVPPLPAHCIPYNFHPNPHPLKKSFLVVVVVGNSPEKQWRENSRLKQEGRLYYNQLPLSNPYANR